MTVSTRVTQDAQAAPRRGGAGDPSTSAPLRTVWLLSVLVALAGFSFEILELNDLYPYQRFLLPLLQAVFAVWAFAEVAVLRNRERSIPLTALSLALAGQMALVAGRLVTEKTVDSRTVALYLPLGLAMIFVPLYSAALLTISKLLVDAFSFTERQRTATLQREVEIRMGAETALQAANSELQRLATTDQLTGARNRAFLDGFLAAEANRARRERTPLSLLMIDVDDFKAINDSFGHPRGDQVLVAVIQRVNRTIPPSAVVARFGGDEFAVAVPGYDLRHAERTAEAIRLLAGTPLPEVGEVTVSIGVAQLGDDESIDAWVRRADAALYTAKCDGRNRVVSAH